MPNFNRTQRRIAGGIEVMPSPYNNAAPTVRSPTSAVRSRSANTLVGVASAVFKMPPSPRLSACSAKIKYLTVITIIKRESTTRRHVGSVESPQSCWDRQTTSRSAYSGGDADIAATPRLTEANNAKNIRRVNCWIATRWARVVKTRDFHSRLR